MADEADYAAEVIRWFASPGPGVYRATAAQDLRRRAAAALTEALGAGAMTPELRQCAADAVTAAVLRWVHGHAAPALLPGVPTADVAEEFIPCEVHRPEWKPACEDCLVVRVLLPAGLLETAPEGGRLYRYEMPCTRHAPRLSRDCQACRVVSYFRLPDPPPPEPEPAEVLECRAEGHDFPTGRRHADLQPGEREACARCGAVRLADDQGALGFEPAAGSRGY